MPIFKAGDASIDKVSGVRKIAVGGPFIWQENCCSSNKATLCRWLVRSHRFVRDEIMSLTSCAKLLFGMLLAAGLSACFSQAKVKPADQKALDERYYALWQDAVAHQGDAQADKTGQALAAFITETRESMTDQTIQNWVCKPWNLQAKEIKLITGERTASFECINLDGMRGSVFNLALPAGGLTEPMYNGYTVKFSGKIEKFTFANDAIKSFYVYVTVSAFEIVDRTRT